MIMMLRCLKKKIMLVMMPMRKTLVVVTVADHWQLLMVLMTLQDAMEAGSCCVGDPRFWIWLKEGVAAFF